jgi:hypothetical protein
VRLTYLGKVTNQGDSPTLYATDRDSYVIQGYRVADHELLAQADLLAGEILVEVYARLFEFLAEDGVDGTVSSWLQPVVHVRDNGNYILQGPRLTDDATRRRMCVPDNEDVIEVPKAAVLALL